MRIPSILENDGQSVFHVSSVSYNLPSSHVHNHNELLFLVSGRLKVENNLETVVVEAPTVIIHNSYTLHRAELLEGVYERYIINFNDETMKGNTLFKNVISFFKSANMTVIKLNTDMNDLIKRYMERFSIMNTSDGSQDLLTCLILYEISKYCST